jgi:hypothetical protein
MTDFDNIIHYLLDEGIEITLRKNDGVLWYDLKTGAKSHLYISASVDGMNYDMRYSKGNTHCDIDAVLCLAKQSRHNRDYMSYSWTTLLVKHELLKRVETVTYE